MKKFLIILAVLILATIFIKDFWSYVFGIGFLIVFGIVILVVGGGAAISGWNSAAADKKADKTTPSSSQTSTSVKTNNSNITAASTTNAPSTASSATSSKISKEDWNTKSSIREEYMLKHACDYDYCWSNGIITKKSSKEPDGRNIWTPEPIGTKDNSHYVVSKDTQIFTAPYENEMWIWTNKMKPIISRDDYRKGFQIISYGDYDSIVEGEYHRYEHFISEDNDVASFAKKYSNLSYSAVKSDEFDWSLEKKEE